MNIFPETYYNRVSEVLTSGSNIDSPIANPENFILRSLELLSKFLNLKNGRVLTRGSNSVELSLRYTSSDQCLPVYRRVGCDGVSRHSALKTRFYVPVSGVASFTESNDTSKKNSEQLSVPITYRTISLGVLQVDCARLSEGDRKAIKKVLSSVAGMFGKIMVENSLCDMPLSA